MEFTHFDESGNAWMVGVSGKADTSREAVAEGCIFMSPECFQKVREGSMKKGDVLGVARVAGIMGAKRTSELIPLCHILQLTGVTIDFEPDEENSLVKKANFCAKVDARTTARYGSKITVALDPEKIHVFDKETEQAIVH
jgi:cyclic pyranopterin phosphate synthase